jgi:hypothetical protein
MRYLVLCILLTLGLPSWSQVNSIGDFTGDESKLYAQTKQVNQFFRRFNGEEDVSGKRFYEGDNGYRDLKARRKYLGILFDNYSPIDQDVRTAFVLDVTDKSAPKLLDFHGKSWFAEVNADFMYNRQKVSIILYLRIEAQNDGYKWVISNIYFDQFAQFFTHLPDTASTEYFLHPMSHELDFMNIHKVFDDPDKLDYYLENNYKPDQLSIFVAEMKTGNLKFVTVNTVKFHFFQIPNWYFEVSYFNRNSNNSGWLISNLVRIDEKEKKQLIRNYTHEQ